MQFPWHPRRFRFALRTGLAGASLLAMTLSAGPAAPAPGPDCSRLPTIRDSITFREIVEPGTNGYAGSKFLSSPDGRLVVFATKRGDPEHNTNEYELYVLPRNAKEIDWTHPAWQTGAPTNAPGISAIQWLDNTHVGLVGKEGSAPAQAISFDVRSGKLTYLTHHKTDVTAFSKPASTDAFAFFARPDFAHAPVPRDQTSVVVGTQDLEELVSGRTLDRRATVPDEMFVSKGGVETSVALHQDEYFRQEQTFPSPDGRYLVFETQTYLSALPAHWRSYVDGQATAVAEGLRILDISTGKLEWVLDRPVTGGRIVWRDTTHIIAALPTAKDAKGRTGTIVADVDVHAHSIRKITDGHFDIFAWDGAADRLVLARRTVVGDDVREQPVLALRRATAGWVNMSLPPTVPSGGEPVLQQTLNARPQIRWTSGHMFDLNPQLREICLVRARTIDFKDSTGKAISGGLFLPATPRPAAGYPLYIQTHGWSPDKFTLDGYDSSAGYAAQALAAQGIAVVQLGFYPIDNVGDDPNGEAPKNAQMFEDVVSHFQKKGLIDANNVALQAFSRSGTGVNYALAFGKLRYKAAVIADAMEAGYWQYLATQSSGPGKGFQDWMRRLNGGSPGDPPGKWIDQSPQFHANDYTAPVLELRFGELIIGWESYAALRAAGKPTELVWLPHAEHNPVLPAERAVSQGMVYDWVRFWLQGYEDPDPKKRDQYERWQKMKGQRTEPYAH